MTAHEHWSHPSRFTLWICIAVILLGIGIGVVTNVQPRYLALLVVAVTVLILFFKHFEHTVLGLLILRSSLDAFSKQGLPAAFALGIDVLTVLYIVFLLVSKRKIYTDGFWWFLFGWMSLQSLWVILLPLGGLGFGTAHLMAGVREWLRVFTGVLIYLLVMQLKGRVAPTKVVSALFLSLIAPLLAASLQATVPPSKLPSFLVFSSGYAIEAGSRMNGTLGHPNVFATFTVLFIGLTLWKLSQSKQKIPWLLLVGLLAFFLVSTKSLTGLVMLVVFIPAFLAPKLNIVNLLSGVLLFGLVLVLFVSSPLGHERLQSLYGTPLLNPDINVSRAIFLQWTDGNSFNWRIAQWTFLLDAWKRSPLLGYGLDTCRFLTVQESYSHNDYIRFIAEEGIIGFALFLIFLVAQFVRLIQLSRSTLTGSSKQNLCFSLLAVMTSMVVGMLAGNIWDHTTLFYYWWTLMAVLGWDWEQPHDEDPNSSLRSDAHLRLRAKQQQLMYGAPKSL
ncbi:MAG TPA: O-antigen ligase family protein [Crinalium sp.]|jgi:O-antigen ligase